MFKDKENLPVLTSVSVSNCGPSAHCHDHRVTALTRNNKGLNLDLEKVSQTHKISENLYNLAYNDCNCEPNRRKISGTGVVPVSYYLSRVGVCCMPAQYCCEDNWCSHVVLKSEAGRASHNSRRNPRTVLLLSAVVYFATALSSAHFTRLLPLRNTMTMVSSSSSATAGTECSESSSRSSNSARGSSSSVFSSEGSIGDDGSVGGSNTKHVRPYIHSPIARALYHRLAVEQEFANIDPSHWYRVQLSRVHSERVRSRFVQLSWDDTTRAFADSAMEKSSWLGTQLWHATLRALIGWTTSRTSLNGWLGRGSMFVLSAEQFMRLTSWQLNDPHLLKSDLQYSKKLNSFDASQRWPNTRRKQHQTKGQCHVPNVKDRLKADNQDNVPLNDDDRYRDDQDYRLLGAVLLDLGAGDGNVTAQFSRFFERTHVTEASPVMRKLLARRGYHVKDVDSWAYEDNDVKYSMISALNLLDRCNAPLSLLKSIPRKLEEDGLVLLALVLPLNQYVETNAPHYRASETIELRGTTFEQQVDSLVECVLRPLGYRLKAWSRVPYLCEGDLNQPYYWLDDVVLLLQHESAMSKAVLASYDNKEKD